MPVEDRLAEVHVELDESGPSGVAPVLGQSKSTAAAARALAPPLAALDDVVAAACADTIRGDGRADWRFSALLGGRRGLWRPVVCVPVRGRALAWLACVCVGVGAWCTPAYGRDAVVTSFDGTPIVAHFYETWGANRPAPTVLVGAGYGRAGSTSPGRDVPGELGTGLFLAAGYNVLTWDPRGLGGSGGTVMFDSPDFEARDVAALVDFVATQPEALLDGAGDPRVGMAGFSYGGGIQFVSAAIDRRIDAIVPDGAWHSLVTSFFKDGAVKAAWLALICGGGEAAASFGGAFFGDAGMQFGGTAPELKRACLEALAGGAISAKSRQWFADRGPGALLDRVRAPTLILQGTTDALLPPSEAIANYDRLRSNAVPVKMMWYCGGHGQCLTPAGDPRYVARAALAWFRRWLRQDVTVDTGPPFEWIADDGVWRAGPDFPLSPAGTLEAAGKGSLTISPADYANSGLLTFATPALNAANARFASARSSGDVVGEPRLRLIYRGTAVPARTFVYAQVVDVRAARVAGAQVTPIPVILDGRTRVVERALEPLALRSRAGSDLRLQITPGTTFYGPQRSVGSIRLQSIRASLPLVDATRSGRASSVASALRTPRRLRISLSSARVRGHSQILLRSRLRSQPCAGTVRFTIRAGSLKRTVRTPVAPACAIRAVLRLRVRSGRRARVSAIFEGNSSLRTRRAHSIVRHLR